MIGENSRTTGWGDNRTVKGCNRVSGELSCTGFTLSGSSDEEESVGSESAVGEVGSGDEGFSVWTVMEW